MLGGELGGFGGGSWEQGEEAGEAVGVEGQPGRELPEEGAQFRAECEDAGGVEVGERGFDVAELLHVGDEAAAFDGEEEVGWRFVAPGSVAFRALEGVEGAVDFHGVHVVGEVLEFAALGELGWVEDAAPGCVAPA